MINSAAIARPSWTSRVGFIFASLGSAVGLVNIWRFPHVTSSNGGGAFVLVYAVFLILLGYPVLFCEVELGKRAQQGPSAAFGKLAPNKRLFSWLGKGLTITGLVISSFYSVVAGWTVGYLVYGVSHGFQSCRTTAQAVDLYDSALSSPSWCLGYQLIFLVIAAWMLASGVRKGIEFANKLMMPALIVLLVVLAWYGFSQSGSTALAVVFKPDWSSLGMRGVLIALGHAFFTLSLGQGTMITYGSYLSGKENTARACFPIVACDTVISLLAGVAVLSILGSAGAGSSSGQGLLFHTLPTVFAKMAMGNLVGILFFLCIVLAALSSQCSAMEPLICYFTDRRGWSRRAATATVGMGALLLGIPSALSFSLMKGCVISGKNPFDLISSFATDILIPIGGLTSVVFVGWIWTRKESSEFSNPIMTRSSSLVGAYFRLSIKYVAPLLILLILLLNFFGV